MIKKIIVVLVILAVLAFVGLTVGVIGRSGPEPTPSAPTTTPVQTVTPAPTATPTPKATPTATPAPTAGGAISIQEFINNAQAGKYKIGDVLKISATYEGLPPSGDDNGQLYFYFGPKLNDLFFMAGAWAISSEALEIAGLKKGDRVVIRGKYEGPKVKMGQKGIALIDCEVI